MKKFTVLFFTFLYLMVNSHLAVSMQSCGSKFNKIKIFSTDKKCVCGAKEVEKPCCKTDKQLLETSPSQHSSSALEYSFVGSCAIITKTFSFLFLKAYKAKESIAFTQYIPLLRDIPIYLLNRALII
ncbi:MAG TPA: hypothetical protein VF691_20445 [Cytophagaceae bacterium]|jgi:hypothetical protein